MGTKSRAAAAMDAYDGQPRFPIHVHRIHGAGTRTLTAANAQILLHSHSPALSLAECVRGTSFHAWSRVAAETDLGLESGAQAAGRADANPAAMPRETFVQQSCASEGARIAPYAPFHSGRAKYLHGYLPYAERKIVATSVETVYTIGCVCPVHESTLLQSLPSGSIFLRAATAMAMGT
jgi:hypothetical protein